MKGEYLEQQGNKNGSPNPNMFSIAHHASEGDPKLSSGDGEIFRRPRGRPPGSKNKPKSPLLVARDADPAMSPYILEVPGGNDVVEAISAFCRRKNIGLSVLTASGTVANVTLRQPSTATPGGTVTFHGRFDILSLSATVLSPPVPNGFTISLAGPQGQVVGGAVAGQLLAAGTVFVVAATFNSPLYHRLAREEEEGQNSESPTGEDGIGMYSNRQLPSDVMWARQSY